MTASYCDNCVPMCNHCKHLDTPRVEGLNHWDESTKCSQGHDLGEPDEGSDCDDFHCIRAEWADRAVDAMTDDMMWTEVRDWLEARP